MNAVPKAAVREYCRSKKRRKKSGKKDSDSDSESDCKSHELNSSLLCTAILPVLTQNNFPNPIKNTSAIDLPGKSENTQEFMCCRDGGVNSNEFTEANSGSTSVADTEVNVFMQSPRTISTGSGKANFKINKIKIKRTNKHKPTLLRNKLVGRSKSTLRKFK